LLRELSELPEPIDSGTAETGQFFNLRASDQSIFQLILLSAWLAVCEWSGTHLRASPSPKSVASA
jgi:hypothetical protein